MHPDDLESARRRLDEAWVPLDERFAHTSRPAHAGDPAKASPAPEPAKEPIGTSLTRQKNEIMAARHKALAVPPAEQCPRTAKGHRWNRWGRKNTHSPWRKRCRDCGATVNNLTEAEYLAIAHPGGKKQRGEA